VKARPLFAALAALAVVVIGSAGAASADQGHQTKYATITKDCINSITGQDEGDITYTGPVEAEPQVRLGDDHRDGRRCRAGYGRGDGDCGRTPRSDG
jgi:hypothetical protein